MIKITETIVIVYLRQTLQTDEELLCRLLRLSFGPSFLEFYQWHIANSVVNLFKLSS